MCYRYKCKAILITGLACLASACASDFPRPSKQGYRGEGKTAEQIFADTFAAHGGAELPQLRDVNTALNGDWKFLITRIQPLVTDHRYRVRSEERIIPARSVYAAHYRGPAGEKKVFRSRDTIEVYYNGKLSDDRDVLQSTALTADAFLIFSLGPLALSRCKNHLQRLTDAADRGKRYYRLYCDLKPGIGFSPRDELILWVDPKTDLTYRVNITLKGYETTQAAHVDVTFRQFLKRGGFILPSKFEERVLAPLKIDAHHWSLTGLDINRGLEQTELAGPQFSGTASAPAAPIDTR